jgi:hypothetical protein
MDKNIGDLLTDIHSESFLPRPLLSYLV